MRGVGGKHWIGARVVQVIWMKFLFQLTNLIAEHLRCFLIKSSLHIALCRLIGCCQVIVYGCNL